MLSSPCSLFSLLSPFPPIYLSDDEDCFLRPATRRVFIRNRGGGGSGTHLALPYTDHAGEFSSGLSAFSVPASGTDLQVAHAHDDVILLASGELAVQVVLLAEKAFRFCSTITPPLTAEGMNRRIQMLRQIVGRRS